MLRRRIVSFPYYLLYLLNISILIQIKRCVNIKALNSTDANLDNCGRRFQATFKVWCCRGTKKTRWTKVSEEHLKRINNGQEISITPKKIEKILTCHLLKYNNLLYAIISGRIEGVQG